MDIHFEKLSHQYLNIILSWLAQDFVIEFWDNTQAHRDDIINFVEGRKTPSSYANGKYVYWLAFSDKQPFAMIMTIQETSNSDINHEKLDRLSKLGNSYSVDYMIGDPKFFGKGYGAKVLSEFIDFFRIHVDSKADTFFIDPDCNNPRAKHVYMKAGFEHVCDFMMEGEVSGAGKKHHLLIKQFESSVQLVEATIEDYPSIQKMWPFYVYDLGRECVFIKDWEWPTDESFVPDDLTVYFKDANKKPFIIKIKNEVAGFALIDKLDAIPSINFYLREFFILAKFQNKGIGKIVAVELFNRLKGAWGLGIIPENKKALVFWRNVLSDYTESNFSEFTKTGKELKTAEYPKPHPMIMFTFDSTKKK